ncbi:sensor histidine kinase [Carboxylicivirga mesophila]|uniref:Sensor histidine kinase n=1 Tax=Carboxylicivirga mesophila TaxID=1166478 RepID=A0ABS5K5Q5_9BACT|nr:sensor histidine kinase [Carboxylicivirga mesophila]MBS2209873.1 sensor histidine kinase [Carboxylicivirga mesophila]
MLGFRSLNTRKVTIGLTFAVYWLIAFFFFKGFYGGNNSEQKVALVFTAIFWFISFVCVDIHHRFVTRPNLEAKRYFRFIIFSLYVFMGAFWLESVLSFILNLYFWDYENGRVIEDAANVSYQVGGVNMIVFGGVAIQFMLETFRLRQDKELQDKKVFERELMLKEKELEMLKKQVNPHFLFNALNCIYGLSLEKSERTPEVILQLSGMLDYMLYKCERNVLLSEEIQQIENYTAIQRVRFGDALQLTMHTEIGRDFEVAPLLLLPLVENAFKHGRPADDGVLHIGITIRSDDGLYVSITNTCDSNVKRDKSGGIGLSNLQRRLALLYPERYELYQRFESNTFHVNLKLNLC